MKIFSTVVQCKLTVYQEYKICIYHIKTLKFLYKINNQMSNRNQNQIQNFNSHPHINKIFQK